MSVTEGRSLLNKETNVNRLNFIIMKGEFFLLLLDFVDVQFTFLIQNKTTYLIIHVLILWVCFVDCWGGLCILHPEEFFGPQEANPANRSAQ